LRGRAALQGADIATTVRLRDGERLLVDGPFMEAKEQSPPRSGRARA
jgi:hypothetical protein